MGTSSFTTAGQWSDSSAPSAGKDYSSMGYLLRTPSIARNYTFAGDSLTVGGGDGGGANPFLTNGELNNNALLNKTPYSPVITVNNLILDAGYIRDGMGDDSTWTLAGNMFVTDKGGGLNVQCTFNINSAISGSGTLYIADNRYNNARRTIYINSSLNSYHGNINLLGFYDIDGRCRLTFSDNGLMNFVIGAGGVNNTISGTGLVYFQGDFNFDLTSAGTNIDDRWTIASATAQAFTSTFTVKGFTDMGNGVWRKNANGVVYEFRETTGTLSVIPEPMTILTLGLGNSMALRRRKAS